MVQRKVPSKLCIPKTKNEKSENKPGKLRPPSPRFQDGKNNGTEMKKKMKRSKSMNRSTIESCLKTTGFIKQVSEPGKPPTDEKQKRSPNYMKSTSSFEARKEQSQVSSQAPVKSPKKGLENSKIRTSSAHIPAKTLTRATSLKRVRTLTKTPSFKPTRAANKKCQKVVLCEDSNSQRATCSSTLKDSKFPNYLELSHGATESEGTSLMKVCPYTYCSLNGHRHALLPPLKSFLSAKRRVLKTQKNIKLGCLSPRRTKPSGDLEREVLGEVVADEKATIPQPKVHEEHMDFYIEIYVENREDDSIICSESNGEGNSDGISNETPKSGNGFENNCEVIKTDADLFPQDEEIGEEAMDIHSVKSSQEEETPEIMSNHSEMELNATDSVSYDMEWEEGQHLAEDKDGYDSENSSLVSGNNPNFHNEKIFSISCFNEILVYEGKEIFVQSGGYETEVISNNKGEVFMEPFEYEEPRALLENEQQYSGEPQQEEIYEDYESTQNNTQVFEIDVQTDLSMTNGESNEVIVDTCQAEICKSLDSIDSEDQTHPEPNKVIIADETISDINTMEISSSDNAQHKATSAEKDETQKQAKTAYTRGRGCSSEDLQFNTINLQITKCNKSEDDLEKEREFNPREPNYLPITPDPEAEKVDLRHQELDDRKNAEEWMIDYALQQTVTKLAPARKRRVALLVEAFEKVIPPHYEPRLKHTSSAFAPIRPIQACS